MIGRILKLGILVFIGLVVYNYFLGTPEEKAKSKDIIGKVSDIGKAGVGLIKEEVVKFQEGKYDRALDKIESGLMTAKEQLSDKGGQLMDNIESWEGKKEAWSKERDRLKELFDGASDEQKEALSTAIEDINKTGEELEEKGKELAKTVEEKIKEEQ